MKLEAINPPTLEGLSRASGVAKDAARNWSAYCRACATRARIIKSILNRIFGDRLSGKKILDWGSAIGGVAILLDDELEAQFTAADVDKHSMAWLKAASGTINTAILEPSKSLPFENNAFDAVYGISVLTHIPPSLQEFYLSELKRITRKDGVVMLTVKSYEAVDKAKAMNKNPKAHPYTYEELDAAGIFYASYPEKMLKQMDFSMEADYGIAYHSLGYIEEYFGKFFEFDREDPKKIGAQRVLVLRPKRA